DPPVCAGRKIPTLPAGSVCRQLDDGPGRLRAAAPDRQPQNAGLFGGMSEPDTNNHARAMGISPSAGRAERPDPAPEDRGGPWASLIWRRFLLRTTNSILQGPQDPSEI